MKFIKRLSTAFFMLFALSSYVFAQSDISSSVDESQTGLQTSEISTEDAVKQDEEKYKNQLAQKKIVDLAINEKESQHIGENIADTAKEVIQDTADKTRKIFGLDYIGKFLTIDKLQDFLTTILALVIFYVFFKILKKVLQKNISPKVEPHTMGLINKIVSYVFYIIMAAYILGLFGIELKGLWGAAGVAGLAIGFAAQTSVSNLISGLFVLTEKTMKIGDFIEVDGVSGTVDEIGLLSVKIHTLDNQLIRIPNSTIINTKLMNYATYDLRRFSFQLSVSYENDLEKALEMIQKIPEMCPSVIKNDPDHAPVAVYSGLADTGIDINLNVWFNRKDLVTVKNEVFIAYTKLCRETPDLDCAYKRIDVSILNDKTNA